MTAQSVSFRNIAPDVKLGQNVQIRDFTNLYGCEIGDESRIGTFVEIPKGVVVAGNSARLLRYTP